MHTHSQKNIIPNENENILRVFHAAAKEGEERLPAGEISI